MSNSSNRDSNDKPEEKEGFFTLVSYNRPLPLGAKRELNEAANNVEFPDDDSRVAYVSDLPKDHVFNDWELTRIRYDSPDEEWETDNGKSVEIYEDRVVMDGAKVTISPEEAKERARIEQHFTRVA